MKTRPFKAMIIADIKNVTRDPMLIMTLASAILIGLVLRFIVPFAKTLILTATRMDITPFIPPFHLLMVFIPAMLAGFMTAFLLLEEKDSHIHESLFTTPLGRSGYYAYRRILPFLLGAVLPLVTLSIAGFARLSADWIQVLVLLAIEAVLFSIVLSRFAANKIEALALGKASGIVIIGLILPWIVPGNWIWFASWLPTAWPGILIHRMPESPIWIIGLMIHIVLYFGINFLVDRKPKTQPVLPDNPDIEQ